MMKQSNDKNPCDWVQANLEPYLEHELPEDSRKKVAGHVQVCVHCQRELKMAQELRAVLHGLPEKSCPGAVRAAVLARARGNRLFGFEVRTRESVFDRLAAFWRPAAAMAAFAAILAIAALFSFKEQKNAAYRPEELAKAEVDLKWTFAYIGNVTRKSTRIVVDDVIPSEILLPLREAVGAAFGTTTQK